MLNKYDDKNGLKEQNSGENRSQRTNNTLNTCRKPESGDQPTPGRITETTKIPATTHQDSRVPSEAQGGDRNGQLS